MKLRSRKEITDFRTVLVSTLVSLFDIFINFVAAIITGSSVMFSQSLQGVADFITTVFLLIGVKRSKRKPSLKHPFGYGRELFFWVLLSSLIAFLFSGGLAVYIAVSQLIEGYEIDASIFGLIVLTIGLITNGYALSNSLSRMSGNYRGKSIMNYLRYSSLIETKMTLLVDLMGTLSAALGIIALLLYSITENTIFDAVGALVIGLFIMLGALFVISDLYDLIIGRSTSPEVIREIKEITSQRKGVQEVVDIRATTIGSQRLFVVIKVNFDDDISTDEIELVTDKIQNTIRSKIPSANEIIVEAEQL